MIKLTEVLNAPNPDIVVFTKGEFTVTTQSGHRYTLFFGEEDIASAYSEIKDFEAWISRKVRERKKSAAFSVELAEDKLFNAQKNLTEWEAIEECWGLTNM